MKKIILGVITCLLSLSVFGQVNEFKFGFPLRANGGLNVGTDKVQLDSIVRDGTTIKFYTGVTELLPNMAGGSVTSVGMTVPTGLSISGSPITSSGTLGLTFAPGYSIPSDASQSNWNTAYNWGDHNLGGYESSLGNPSVNGYILSSTTTGTRSWIAPPSGGSMIYPSGSGIPLVVSGTSWGTTITNNSANWNTAYGWGNHASAGYQTSTAILNSFAALTNSAGVLTNDGSGGLTWTAVGGTGTVTSVALSVPTGLSISGSPITSSGTLAISLASGYSIPSTSVQSNWTTAYNERAQWDGGSTNLVASTGRTSLGATTVGSNLFTLTNPSAIRFIRINADNTVSVLTATDFKTALSLSASDVSLGNVTNESKTTMFTSPIFTGVAPRLGSPVTDTVATRGNIRSAISALLSGGIQLSDVAVMREDTLTSGGIYYTQRQVDSIMATITGVSLTDVNNAIRDSLNAIRANSIPGLAAADTADLIATQYYISTHGGSSWDSTYIHYRVDSLEAVIDAQSTEIENLWNAIALLGDMDIIAPRFESAELGTFADDTLVVVLDTTDVRQDSIPLLTAFTLWAGAIEHGIASVDIGHDTLYIALDSAGVYGATYTLDYTRGTPALQDSTGNKTASWTGRSVTNNISEPAATGLLEGLVAYWDMQESSGAIVDEVASLTSTGTVGSTAIEYSMAGILGNSLEFNYLPTYGGGQRIIVGDDVIQPANISVSLWFYLTSTDADAFCMIHNTNPGTQNRGYYFITGGVGGGVAARVYNSSGTYVEVDSDPSWEVPSANTWYHAVFVADGTNLTVYVNGVQRAQSAFAYDISYGADATLIIGGRDSANGWTMNGRLDEIGMWNRALTTDEITALYNSGSGLSYSSFGN